MTVPVKRTNIVEEELAHFTGLYEDKPVRVAISTSYLEQFQEIETMWFALLWVRLLANAFGFYLDVLGAMVDEPRAGRGDSRYRLAIKVKARVNRSQGRTIDISDVLDLLVDDWGYKEWYPEKFSVFVEAVSGRELVRWLSKARKAATQFELVYRPEEDADTRGFKFDSVYGGVATPGRFATVYNSTTGDPLYTVIRG